MDTKGLQKEFIAWCKANKKSPKSEQETKLLFVSFMKEKHPEEYKAAVANQLKQQLQQAQKAAHGAKLNYFKSLKNQCAEDEEVVYYKKGGSVTCGCKKKEDGGEIPTAKEGSVIAKFKKMRTGGNTVVNGSTKLPTIDGTKKMSEDPNKNTIWDTKLKKMRKMTPEEIARTEKNKADARQGKGEGTPQRKCGGKVKKHQEGSVITKFKMHRKGGSLNGIPFYLGGTPEGGILSMAELIPIYGTYEAGKRFFRNPSWKTAGEFALSGLGDAAMLTGIGAGAGMALKAGNMAAKAGKVAKAASNFKKIKAARNLKYSQPYGISGYSDDAVRTASNLASDALAYGTDYGKAVQQGNKLIHLANWADEAANTYRSAKWVGANGLNMGIAGAAYRGTNK